MNEIYNGDCLKFMGNMNDNTVDLVVTDPPYGIDFNSNRRVKSDLKSTKGILNDGIDNLPFLESVALELYRVLKDDSHLYWFTRWDKLEEQIPMLRKAGFSVKNNLVWMKNSWSMGDLKGAYAGQYECIIFCQKGSLELNEVNGRKRHSDILVYDRVASSKLKHSHEKPIPLIDMLIRKSSEENQLVFDPFLGSGTTAVAAHGCNRNYKGCELDKKHYMTAKQRIETAESQSSIFDFI